MPVLLLCQGDAQVKTILREAIQARYGINPPAIERLRLVFKGRAQVNLGFMTTAFPVEATVSFMFPTHFRCDAVVKLLGLPIQRMTEVFDGTHYYAGRGRNVQEITAEERLQSIRRRLWMMASVLLTPLSDPEVHVTECGHNCIEAEHTALQNSVQLRLRDDHTIESARVHSVNPFNHREQLHHIHFPAQLIPVDGLMLPERVEGYWDQEPAYEMQPMRAEINPELPESLFAVQRS